MKKLSAAAFALMAASACMSSGGKTAAGMANPASEYCVKQGGRVEIKKDAAGNEYGLCRLPDGSLVEEWAFFRSRNGR